MMIVDIRMHKQMRATGKREAGLSIIELLVGITIGLIITAAATVMMVSTMKSHRNITASAKLNQELGAVMAVMANEIRRAGFRVCDRDTFSCPPNAAGEIAPFLTYAFGEDIGIGQNVVNGDCILYRYNADVDGDGHDGDASIVDDDDDDDLSEHRGFRLRNNAIQMTRYPPNHDGIEAKCNDDPAAVAEYKWIDLTDPDLIEITGNTGLSFSTAGSKCRNMDKDLYWVVGAGTTGMACNSGTAPVVCTDLSGAACTQTTVNNTLVESGDQIFDNRQILIELEAKLTKDKSVSKNLTTTVKVANPWTGSAP